MEVMEMSGRVTLISVLVLLVFLFFTFVQGQSTTGGFLNIDCGLPNDRTYNDKFLSLPYISDYEFIDTGESHPVSADLFVTDFPESYVRSFPNGTRNCYNIKPAIQGWKYLVRARFRYGNYDGHNKFPQFDLHLGINYWGTISVGDVNITYNLEIIAVAVSNSISLCLVNTNQGIPFISTIELRSLPNNVYSEANTSQSLTMLARQNLGGVFSRYPEDTYDRFWFADTSANQLPTLKAPYGFSIRTSVYMEPPDVMETLVYPDETATDLTSNFSTESVSSCPSNRAYLVFYFAELKLLQSRILHVSVDGVVISGEIKPEYLKTSTFEKSISFSGNKFMCSVANASGSTGPPILNALEVYKIVNLSCQSETRTVDVDAIMDIKKVYMVKKNWNGDPCAPKDYMWEGLNCSFNGSKSPSITSLDLSSSGLSGAILASFANLTALQNLDLSHNSLTGGIPDFFSQLSQLKVLNLSNNRLSGSIPKILLDMSTKGQLNLSTDGNPNLCTTLDSCGDSSKKDNKVMLISVISCVVVIVLMMVVVSIVVWRRSGKNQHNLPTKFTRQAIAKITEKGEKIAEGGYGKVYRCTLDNGVQVAVKTLLEDKLSESGVKGFQAEVNILTTANHKNLVRLIAYCDDNIMPALVYEYMKEGSLHDHLSDEDKRKKLKWGKRLKIAFDVAEGLKYLHEFCRSSVVHRDIKPLNILLTEKLEARIGDFGLSKIFKNDAATHATVSRNAGTPGYIESEPTMPMQAKKGGDVYSFGVVLMNLVTGLPPNIKYGQDDIEGNRAIVDWIRHTRPDEEVRKIFDKKILNDYDADSVRKVVNLAKECTISEEQPNISYVADVLKDCLGKRSKKNHASSSKEVNLERSDAPMLPKGEA